MKQDEWPTFGLKCEYSSGNKISPKTTNNEITIGRPHPIDE